MTEHRAGYTAACFSGEDWSKVSENLQYRFESMLHPSTLMQPEEALDSAVE